MKLIKEKNQIFISYAKEDWGTAKRFYDDLKKLGFNPWLDTEKLLPGQNWRETIYNAIKKSNYFIAIISSKSISKRGFVQKELKIAFDLLDEFPSTSIFLIPVRIDACKPKDNKLRELHWVDMHESYTNCLNKITKVIAPENHQNLLSKIEKLQKATEILSGSSPKQIQYIEIVSVDRIGLLADMASFLAKANLEILSVRTEILDDQNVGIIFGVKILEEHLKSMKKIKGILKVGFAKSHTGRS